MTRTLEERAWLIALKTMGLEAYADMPRDKLFGPLSIQEPEYRAKLIAGELRTLRDECARVCEAERVRQINGDRFERLSGQDTAFSLMNKIRQIGEK